MTQPHKKLQKICSTAKNQVVLIAPFMKYSIVSFLENEISDDVELHCITRWRPEEVVAGVTDLEIFDIINNRENAELYLSPYLHAKYYRGDEQVLIGSANLTQRALGWSNPSNIELLVNAGYSDKEIQDFESKVFSSAIKVDQELREIVQAAVDQVINKDKDLPWIFEIFPTPDFKTEVSIENWVPLCPAPDRLFNIYANFNTWELVSKAAEDAKKDLDILNIPPGLNHTEFRKFVAANLDQMPLINEIDRKSESGISDEAAKSILLKKATLLHSVDNHWKILKKWLIYFFPGRYRVRTEEEELIRGRIIGR